MPRPRPAPEDEPKDTEAKRKAMLFKAGRRYEKHEAQGKPQSKRDQSLYEKHKDNALFVEGREDYTRNPKIKSRVKFTEEKEDDDDDATPGTAPEAPGRDVDQPIHRAKLKKVLPNAYETVDQPGATRQNVPISHSDFLEKQREHTRKQIGNIPRGAIPKNFVVEKPLHPSPLDYYSSALIRKQNQYRFNSLEAGRPFVPVY
jgi:hypothetical protein